MVSKKHMDWQEAKTTSLQPLFRAKRLGLISDMDGTLSPLVEVPSEAIVLPEIRDTLQVLHEHLPLVAIVSGRAVGEVRRIVGLPSLTYVGNHGLETWQASEVIVSPEAQTARPQLEKALAEAEKILTPGMWIEDKIATASIHYRQAQNPEETAERLWPQIQAIAEQNELRAFQGRMIFELRPSAEINKGTSFRRLVVFHQLDGVVWLGDDTTDVDAMRAARQLREAGECYALSLGVQSDDSPAEVLDTADLLVDGVSGVAEFLDWFLMSLKASST
jgi:trehalose 6-phosphate phosphatase